MAKIQDSNSNITNLILLNKNQQSADSLKNTTNQGFKDDQARKKAAQELEAVFLNSTLGIVFADVTIDPLLKDDSASRFYKSMMIDSISQEISKSGTLGIAKCFENYMLKRMDDNSFQQFLKLQEVDKNEATNQYKPLNNGNKP
jgi:Rod binding domain-containing protein